MEFDFIEMGNQRFNNIKLIYLAFREFTVNYFIFYLDGFRITFLTYIKVWKSINIQARTYIRMNEYLNMFDFHTSNDKTREQLIKFRIMVKCSTTNFETQ